MDATDRPQFEKQLAELFGALDKPLTKAKLEGFWKGLRDMGLADFSRCCDYILAELHKHPLSRTFSVGSIWEARRQLRAQAPPERPPDDGWRGDAWDLAANRHLLAYLLEHRIPGQGPSFAAMRDKTRLADKVLDASPEFVQNVKVLVAYKNAWATDMRDEAVNGEVPVARQQETWAGCMKRAAAQIAGEVT